MAKRKQFTFYESFYGSLLELPLEEALPTLWVIVTYGLYGRKPRIPLSSSGKAVIKLVKPVLDSARKKSQGAVKGNKMRCKSKRKPIPGSCPDNAREKEKEEEVEVENEVEVEEETEIELEKESLYTDGVCVNRDTDTDRFERFWALYPNKLGKQKAWEAWQMENPNLDKLVVALECWKNSRQWLQDNGRFIPKAENFIKEKYDLQVPDGAVPRGASGYLGKAEVEAIERLMNGTV